MEGPAAHRHRPTIEERASKRDQIHTGANDRYSSLMEALSGGRPLLADQSRPKLTWHPVMWTLIRILLVLLVAYLLALYGWRWWRQQQTDVWSGPSTSVVSGQRLSGCDAANLRNDDAMPTWIRWAGHVFVQTDRILPVLNQSLEGQTQFIETGYSLSQLRIVLPATTVAGQLPAELLVVSPPGIAASVFKPDASCV